MTIPSSRFSPIHMTFYVSAKAARMIRIMCTSLIMLALFSCLTTIAWAGDAVIIARGSGPQAPKQPQAVIAEDGIVHLVYGIGNDVFYCQSRDQGKTFSEATKAFRMANMSLGKRRGPRVSATGGIITVSVIGGPQGKGRDGDINVWRSSDAGKSWQGPVLVNDQAASAREGLHAMAADSSGNIYCVWLDLRSKKTELYASRSSDGGATWSKNVFVYRSPSGSICECCHPSLTIKNDSVHVLFRNSLDGNRDMYLATSASGQKFDHATRLGSEHWQLNACPMDGGMLSVEDDGTVSTVWRRGGLVYSTRGSASDETLLGRGEQPWVASTSDDSFAIWTSAREGKLFVTSLKNIEPRELAPVASDPMIATAPSGRGPTIVVYESKHGDQMTIEAQPLNFVKATAK